MADDEVFAISEDLVTSPIHKTSQTTSVSFSGLLRPPLTLHEDLTSGCGGQLWPAGMVLATHLLQHERSTLAGKRMFVLPSLPYKVHVADAAADLSLGLVAGLLGNLF